MAGDTSVVDVCSGQDGTVRVWTIGSRTHAFLQQTCIFNKGDEQLEIDLEDQLLAHVCWNYTGKLIAGAVDNMINIWTVSGRW